MAAKIKDGLFIGDEETSRSEVFINDNKISNLINLSGKEVKNHWESYGLVYLTYNWEDNSSYRLLSGAGDPILQELLEFIDVSLSHGISVLLFSTKGLCRCALASCLYLMMKYYWGFEKAYDYVYTKKPDIKINKNFIQQMFSLDIKLLQIRQNNLSKFYEYQYDQELKKIKLKQQQYGESDQLKEKEKKLKLKLKKIQKPFQIESSMTINDIACMLPKNEAKRWCSWDPSYIIYDYQKLLATFIEENNLYKEEKNKSPSKSKSSTSKGKKLVLRDKIEEKASNEDDYYNDEFEDADEINSTDKSLDEEEERAKSSSEFDFDPLTIDPKKYDEKIQKILIERDEIIKKINTLKIPSNITLFSSSLSSSSFSYSSLTPSSSFSRSQILEDIEEELVMIFSYINGKNTISSLPGPYLNQEDGKDFKLRFNSTTYYEDFGPSLVINSFAVMPSSSSPIHTSKSIYSIKLQPKYSILKGSKSKKQYEDSKSQDKLKQNLSPNKKDSEFKSSYQIDYKSGDSPSSPAPSNSAPDFYSSPSSPSNDLFSFVGMSPTVPPSKTPSSSKSDAKEEKKIRDDKISSDVFSTPSLSSTTSAGLSAEDRLRKLMADMQRQSHFPQHLYEASGGGNIDNYFNSPHMDSYSTSKKINHLSDSQQNESNCFMSLYDIANLAPKNNPSNQIYMNDLDNSTEDYDLESESIHDPLSAFNSKELLQNDNSRLLEQKNQRENNSSISSTSRPNSTATSRPSSATSRTSALRARHDIPTSNPSRLSSSSSRLSTGGSSGNKQAFTSPPSSSASVSSINSSNSTRSNTSKQQVGSGTSSSSKIYRHGSPAPNTTRSTSTSSSLRNKSSNTSSNSSVGSIRSVSSSLSVSSTGSVPKNHFSSPLTGSTSSNSTNTKRNSIGGSNDQLPSSRINSSPLRASYSGGSSSNSTSRPSSPSLSNSRRQSIGERQPTPTKTWRF